MTRRAPVVETPPLDYEQGVELPRPALELCSVAGIKKARHPSSRQTAAESRQPTYVIGDSNWRMICLSSVGSGARALVSGQVHAPRMFTISRPLRFAQVCLRGFSRGFSRGV